MKTQRSALEIRSIDALPDNAFLRRVPGIIKRVAESTVSILQEEIYQTLEEIDDSLKKDDLMEAMDKAGGVQFLAAMITYFTPALNESVVSAAFQHSNEFFMDSLETEESMRAAIARTVRAAKKARAQSEITSARLDQPKVTVWQQKGGSA